MVSLFNQPHPSLLTGTDSSVTCCVRRGWERQCIKLELKDFPFMNLFTTLIID